MNSFWLRVSSGIFVQTWRSTFSDKAESSVCTSWAPASTVTCSLVVPISSFTSRVTIVPTVTTIS